MSAFKKRTQEGFNLSFLDVMACGLGAVILILILVKFNATSDIPSEQLDRLSSELDAATTQTRLSQQSRASEQTAADNAQALLTALQNRIATLSAQVDETKQSIDTEKTRIAELETSLANAPPLIADDNIVLQSVGEENYLLGLNLSGSRIGILLDMSASMTADSLIEVIRRKVGTDTDKTNGPKWQRTLAILNWMLARVPTSSQLSVVAFNDSSTVLGSNAINEASEQEALVSIAKEASSLVPQNGTNLIQALDTMARTLPGITDLYLITDGLPTLVDASVTFPQSRDCKPFAGQQATITGECRFEAFAHTMRGNPLASVRTHVVLLPLEGDPSAPAAYWSWTDGTQGTFIAPAGSWP